MSRPVANLVLLLAGALWGMGFVAQSTAMAAVGPFLFVGLRFLVAAVAMLPFALREHAVAKTGLQTRDWRAFAVIGLFLFGGMAAQQVGLLTTTVTNSGFLTGLYVVMVPFLAVLIYRQWPHPVVWPSAAMALAGIWLLSGGAIERLTVGDWLTILCALFWALQMIFIARHAAGSGRPVTLAVTQFAVCAALGLAVALLVEPIGLDAIRAAAPEILYAGIFSGGIAFTLQAVGQRYTTAPQAAIFLASESVFAALFGAYFLGERLPAAGLAGCGLIFAAIILVEALPPLIERRRRTA
ncbi:DMT family transporter [Nitratireductor mangrovi]|uniref:DMT family transporter n=1 Tax=Nitratireductor mangrovi TaxID=2599600 RepID=A0A5B8L2N1_9HYPH|nr:DMT family transporter [Nitratireductor mangrovi]QDZ01992.1 DMT family transporter [Nitratireductor mangrovi]